VDNLLHTVRHDLTIAASSTEQSAKRAIRCLQVHRDHLVTQTDGRAANVARHSASYLHPGFSSYLVCYSAVSLRRSATPRPIWARWSAAAQCGQMPAPDSRRRTRSKDFGIAADMFPGAKQTTKSIQSQQMPVFPLRFRHVFAGGDIGKGSRRNSIVLAGR
jgi:hypothetical protein